MLEMTAEEAKDFINANPELYLSKARKTGYICPLCGNGSGDSGTGLSLDPKDKSRTHWHCFVCGFHGDMIELIAKENGIENGGSAEAFKKAREAFGIKLKKEPYTDFAKTECLSYLQARGISAETETRLGFTYKGKMLQIPVQNENESYFIGRNTEVASGEGRYHIPKGKSAALFNTDAFKKEDPVFITEGAVDAASLEEAGFSAAGLNSTSNITVLIKYLRNTDPKPVHYFVCMDNDSAGQKAEAELLNELKKMNLPCSAFHVNQAYKDANEALTGNREELKQDLQQAVSSIGQDEQQALIEASINEHRVSNLLPAFTAYVHDGEAEPVRTGFNHFDIAIGGGLLQRLYVVGAITSLGKSAFCLQICDQIAKKGTDVLIFALEMTTEEIIARSISRITFEKVIREKQPESLAKTELGISQGRRYADYSEEERKLIADSLIEYGNYAGERINIYAGRYTASQIRQTVQNFISFTGRKPVVLVDYLQIIQPEPEMMRATVREQIDFAVDTLIGMRRDMKIPIVAVSAFNRSNYTSTVDLTALKESGSIEYTADCVISLELDIERPEKGSDGKVQSIMRDKVREAMRADTREIKLTFHKNRGNRVGSQLYFLYNPKFNHFREDWAKDDML